MKDLLLFIDRAAIRTALSAYPELRGNLRSVFTAVTNGAFTPDELDRIESELIGVIRIPEALQMSSVTVAAGGSVTLSPGQQATLRSVIGRFRNGVLAAKVGHQMNAALIAGRLRSGEL